MENKPTVFSSINTFPPKSTSLLLDLSVLYTGLLHTSKVRGGRDHTYMVLTADQQEDNYHNICSLINTWPKQLQENEMLHRMSIIGLELMPTFVSALNSTIVFLF